MWALTTEVTCPPVHTDAIGPTEMGVRSNHVTHSLLVAAVLLADGEECGWLDDLVAFGKRRREEDLAVGALGDGTLLLGNRLACVPWLLHGPLLDKPFPVCGDGAISQREVVGSIFIADSWSGNHKKTTTMANTRPLCTCEESLNLTKGCLKRDSVSTNPHTPGIHRKEWKTEEETREPLLTTETSRLRSKGLRAKLQLELVVLWRECEGVAKTAEPDFIHDGTIDADFHVFTHVGGKDLSPIDCHLLRQEKDHQQFPDQRLSTLCPFNMVPHAVLTPNHRTISISTI